MHSQNNFKQYLNSNTQLENEKLTEKEMQDLQEAIDNSKKTVEVEKQQRDVDRQSLEIAECFISSPKSNDQGSKVTVSTPRQWNKQRSPLDGSGVIKKDFKITFQDLPKASDKSLDVLHHPAVFDLPVNTDPAFQKYSSKIRKRLLFNYFTKLSKLQGKYARRSLKVAPYPKPILPSNKFENPVANNFHDDKSIDEITNQTSQSLYVSRAGRQVKRKIYTEDDEVDSDYDLSSFKRNKADDLDLKITLETPLFTEDSHTEEKTPSKITKVKKDDSPWRPSPSTRRYSNRCEEMFNKLKQDEERRKRQEEEENIFVNSLNPVDDDEQSDSIKIIQDDEYFEKVRVTPPIPRRGRPRKLSKAENIPAAESEKKTTKLESPPKSPILRRFVGRGKPADKVRVVSKGPKAKEEEASTSKLQKVTCPICSKDFLQTEIENHASNCGIYDDILEDSPTSNRSSVKTVCCELCEKEFDMNRDFEVHVQQCVAAHVTDM